VTLSRHRVAGALLTAAVVAAVVAGIIMIGSPTEERVRLLDERRVQDLGRIARASDLYWTRHDRLAASIEELTAEPGTDLDPSDPSTGSPYEYRPIDARMYELCAAFESDSTEARRGAGDFWSHGSGRQCFRREARKVE
jgi:hypothetical protein